MATRFYILLSLKTAKGFINYAQYDMGDERREAEELFGSLQGEPNSTDSAALHIDLMETIDELPVKVKTIGCNLDELAGNHKLLTRAIFRRYNLGEVDA